MKKNIEVCFSPAVYPSFHSNDAIVVVTDILRATSAICTAFMSDVKCIIPVGTLEEAKDYKRKGYMVAAERDGIVRDFADFGNSPFNFTPDRVKNKQIVYSTTNGTQAIHVAKNAYRVIIGAYLNLQSIVKWLVKEQRDVVILCAAWKNKFSLEDSVYAGALVDELLKTSEFDTICDSSLAAQDLWLIAKNNLTGYIEKAAQRSRLRKNGLDDVIEYCHTLNLTDIIPVFKSGVLIPLTKYDEHIDN